MSLRVRMAGIFSSLRSLRTILVHVAVVAVFGVFLPGWLGFQFLDPVTIAAYSCLGVLFAAPAAAQALADERPRNFSDAVKKIAASAAYGEAMAIVILTAGFMTMFFTRSRALIVIDGPGLGQSILLGVAGSLAMAAIAGLLGLALSKGASRMALRVIFLGLLFLFFFRSRWLPDVQVVGTLVCLGIAAAALATLRVMIPPHDL